MVIVGGHGILSDGSGSVIPLLGCLHRDYGHDVINFLWGPATPIRAALRAKRLGRMLGMFAGNVVIAHSFFARIVLESMCLGYRFPQVFLFNPAIPEDTWFPPDKYDRLHVIAHAQDTALRLGDMFLWMFGYGEMGRVGYLGGSPRVHTYFGPIAPKPGHKIQEALDSLRDHGRALEPEHLAGWARFIDEEIQHPF